MKKRIRLVFILVTAGLLSGLIACGQAEREVRFRTRRWSEARRSKRELFRMIISR